MLNFLVGVALLGGAAYAVYRMMNAKEAPPVDNEAPKTEPTKPAEPAKCGCGRSITGYCVGLHKLSEEEWAVHKDNPASFAKGVADSVLSIEPIQATAAAPVMDAPAAKPKRTRKPKDPAAPKKPRKKKGE